MTVEPPPEVAHDAVREQLGEVCSPESAYALEEPGRQRETDEDQQASESLRLCPPRYPAESLYPVHRVLRRIPLKGLGGLNITRKKDALPDADDWKDKAGKFETDFSPEPAK
jgi:hypothetical protein